MCLYRGECKTAQDCNRVGGTGISACLLPLREKVPEGRMRGPHRSAMRDRSDATGDLAVCACNALPPLLRAQHIAQLRDKVFHHRLGQRRERQRPHHPHRRNPDPHRHQPVDHALPEPCR